MTFLKKIFKCLSGQQSQSSDWVWNEIDIFKNKFTITINCV